ncbi:hypothetical protein L7F22_009016 [Adiantum nelumboides]|nr:hypothetical protein [Adiantum nelumboides]
MRMKPHVDALCVEAMLASGKPPALLVFFKFTEADGTFQKGLLFSGGDFVGEDGESFDDGFVKPDCAICGAVGLLAGELEAAAAAPGGKALAAGRGVAPEPLCIDMESEDEEDDNKEHNYGSNHHPAIQGVLHWVVGRRRATGEACFIAAAAHLPPPSLSLSALFLDR